MSGLVGKEVLVTGGAGMLGSWIAEKAVRQGARVTVLDAMAPDYGGNAFNLAPVRDEIRFVQGDIRDAELLAREAARAQVIFNLAAQVSYIDSNLDLLGDLDVNCRGQILLLEAARKAGNRPKIVFASSRFVYGRIEYNPVDERHPLNCLSVYGIHKIAAEKYHRFFYERHGIPTVCLRIANPYGPRQQMKHSKYGIVNWFIRQALDGRPLTVFGTGSQKRDYVYVEDVAEAFLAAACSPNADGQVYNVGAGKGIAFREMAERIAYLVPGTQVIQTEWRAGSVFVETGDYVSDIRKIRKETGWFPKTGFSEGLERTLAYYRSHRDHYWSADEQPEWVPGSVSPGNQPSR